MSKYKDKLIRLKNKDYFTLKQLINSNIDNKVDSKFIFELYEQKIYKAYTNKTKFITNKPTFKKYFLDTNRIYNPFICDVIKVLPHHLIVKEYSTELTFALPIYEIARYYITDEIDFDGLF